jgi:putative restriction endonuclease
MSNSEKAEGIVVAFEQIKIWHRRGERAPHKPLLLLVALGRVSKGNPRLEEFSSYQEMMRSLLSKYAPQRRSIHSEYPFWRLQTDGLWEVQPRDGLRIRKINKDPLKSELLEKRVKGGFKEEVWLALKNDPTLLKRVVQILVTKHFPPIQHDSVIADVGFSSGIR